MMHRVFSRRVLVILAITVSYTGFAAEAPAVRAPPTNDVTSLALSPDGLTLAVVSRFNGRKFAGDGKSFSAAAPVRLFSAPMNASPENNAIAQQYLVSEDGERFLVIAAPDAESPVHMHMP